MLRHAVANRVLTFLERAGVDRHSLFFAARPVTILSLLALLCWPGLQPVAVAAPAAPCAPSGTGTSGGPVADVGGETLDLGAFLSDVFEVEVVLTTYGLTFAADEDGETFLWLTDSALPDEERIVARARAIELAHDSIATVALPEEAPVENTWNHLSVFMVQNVDDGWGVMGGLVFHLRDRAGQVDDVTVVMPLFTFEDAGRAVSGLPYIAAPIDSILAGSPAGPEGPNTRVGTPITPCAAAWAACRDLCAARFGPPIRDALLGLMDCVVPCAFVGLPCFFGGVGGGVACAAACIALCFLLGSVVLANAVGAFMTCLGACNTARMRCQPGWTPYVI